MLAVFYQMNKRVNSTKTPTNEMITVSGEVALKAPTSLHEPTILFACGAADMPKAMTSNYCAFNNEFYWITDKRMVRNDHIEFDCTVDVLATYKNEILLTTAYIVRSSNKGNLNLPDPLIKSTASLAFKESFGDFRTRNGAPVFSKTSNLILNTTGANENTDNVGMLNTYILTEGEAETFTKKICAPDLWDQFLQLPFSPFDFLLSAYLSPLATEFYNAEWERIQLGNFNDNNVTGGRCAIDQPEFITEIKIPKIFDDFRNTIPYTQLSLYLPFVGNVQLDTARAYNSRAIIIQGFVAVQTGDIIYDISYDQPESTEATTNVITYTGNCYMQIPVAKSGSNVEKIASAVISIGSFLAISAITGGAGSSAAGLGEAVAGTELNTGMIISGSMATTATIGAIAPINSMNGAISTNLAKNLILRPHISAWAHKSADEPNNITRKYGNPCEKVYRISDLTGYVQTQGFSLSAVAMEDEIIQVNQLMDGGVYLE